MNEEIERELEILWSEFEDDDVDIKLAAFDKLQKTAEIEDLPQLVDALESDKSDFWVRELLSGPIADLGGPKYLRELFQAQQKNYEDGHDNDTLNFHLTEIARAEPAACKVELIELIDDPSFAHNKSAEWLLDFCEE